MDSFRLVTITTSARELAAAMNQDGNGPDAQQIAKAVRVLQNLQDNALCNATRAASALSGKGWDGVPTCVKPGGTVWVRR